MYSSHLRNTSSRSQASSVPLPHAAADTYVRRDRYQLYLHGKRTMAEHEDEGTGDGLPVAPSMDVALASSRAGRERLAIGLDDVQAPCGSGRSGAERRYGDCNKMQSHRGAQSLKFHPPAPWARPISGWDSCPRKETSHHGAG